MTDQLQISVGQASDKGRKPVNQDFFSASVPPEPLLTAKGVAVALADGISTSPVSQIASQTAVTGFLEDYYATSEAWSVKNASVRVLTAINAWLYAQLQNSHDRFDKDAGYVCTFSGLVIKSTTAHLLHVGDSRIYRVYGKSLEQLTKDHRVALAEDKSYLSRALGIEEHLDIDYQSLSVEKGDVFLLATDGVYEFCDAAFIAETIDEHADDLDHAAKLIIEQALAQGSDDNLTVQIVRVDALPSKNVSELYQEISELPFAPMLEPRMTFDGYTILRQVHASSRSHVHLAMDNESKEQVIIKTPSIDLRGDAAYLERFLLEEWIAKRINDANVLKPCVQTRKRNYLYIVSEYIEGQTLMQWMIDHPQPDLTLVRDIVEQIAKGLRAFHRLEMLHQDLRPQNIMIDSTGTVKIIDFGSTRVAGLTEMTSSINQQNLLGTALYSAPEYFLGEEGTVRSDIFSLGVIVYHMLTGEFPYGNEVAKIKNKSALNRLIYNSIRNKHRQVPVWVDEAIMKAVHPNRLKRYEALSEFVFDLKQPNQSFLKKARQPLIERNPIFFWKAISFVLACVVLGLLIKIS